MTDDRPTTASPEYRNNPDGFNVATDGVHVIPKTERQLRTEEWTRRTAMKDFDKNPEWPGRHN